ncbi:hypothetical protein [Intestinibacter sp.]|uniref:hypothetical protein n=1 Tax=Intestinibacter sp. TaxID=1965304 RepID=UPI002A75ABEA|nr:hypothetical protein [Intestinibacter sp.]MDY2737919.1 hypothetical protein [Intestinibacter sp.]
MYNCRFILNFEDGKKDVDILAKLETLPQIGEKYEFEINNEARNILEVGQINKVIKTDTNIPGEKELNGYMTYDIYCYENKFIGV